MKRQVFFDWLDDMILSGDSLGLYWQVAEDDGTGCITIKFHNVEEEEEAGFI